MSSTAPIHGSGLAHRLAGIWADIRYANLRMVELNRPGSVRNPR